MKHIFLIVITFFLLKGEEAFAQCNQGDVTTFQKTFGGPGNERGHSVQNTPDGGFIVAGETTSYGAGGKDWFVMKLDANGVEQWTKTYGGSSNDDGWSISIKNTTDGGYIVCGDTENFGAGTQIDPYILKLDNLGNIQWEKRITGSNKDFLRDLLQSQTGDYLFTGTCRSYGAGSLDCYLTKISSTGNLLWTKSYGGAGIDNTTSIIEETNNDIYITGHSKSYSNNQDDGLIIKVDPLGNLLWSKIYNGVGTDFFYSSIKLQDGNLLHVGGTNSYGSGGFDVFLVKTDVNGDLIWSKTFGGSNDDIGVGLVEKSNGEIVISAFSNSFGNMNDLLLINLDQNGVLLWSKTFGGFNNDYLDRWGSPVNVNSNDEIIITGGTSSFGAGNEDVYIVKSNSCGNSFCNEQVLNISTTSPIISVINVTPLVSSGGVLLNTNTTSNAITFQSNVLCQDILQETCNLTSNFSEVNTCLGDSTFFTDLSIDSITTIINWKWYFGDGDSLVGIQNPAHLYSNSGTYNVTLAVLNDSNCIDSTTQQLIINPIFSINQTQSICQGDSLFLNGAYQTVAGSYADSLQTVFGCDSIVITSLTVNPRYVSSQSQIICQGDSVFFGGSFYNVAGVYTDSLQTVLGCDSLIELDLIVNPIYLVIQNQTICQGDSILFGGSFYSTTGIYTNSMQTTLGCDSLIDLNLTVSQNYIITQNQTICQGDSVLLSGNYQNSTGVYIDNLQTTLGCDSVLTTNLTVNPLPVISVQSDTTISPCDKTLLNVSGADSYTWSPSLTLSCDVCQNPTANPAISTNYTVTGEVNGCFSNASVHVYVDGIASIIIPNVFTPNFDGINDGFNLEGDCIKSVHKRIYNRWGMLLFESTQIAESWDGRTRSGKIVPEGSYYYIFTVSFSDDTGSNEQTFKGAFSLMR